MTYKEQHYLPAAYLRWFGHDPAKGRKARVYRLTADGSQVPVTVESQCVETHFYSKARAKEVEEDFQRFENMYAPLVRELQTGKLSQESNFDAFRFMLHLHARNKAYENRTDAERAEQYRKIRDTLMGLAVGSEQESVDAAAAILRKRWRVLTVRWPNEEVSFITSDHPVLIWAADSGPMLLFMPVLPSIGIFCYRPEQVAVVGSMTPDDVTALNLYQCGQSLQAVYSRDAATDDEREMLAAYMQARRPERGYAAETAFSAEYLKFPVTNARFRLSFLEPIGAR